MNMTAEQRKNTRPDIDRTDVVFAEDGTGYSVDRDFDDLDNGENTEYNNQNKWVSEYNVLNESEIAEFYRDIGEQKKGNKFPVAVDGTYMYETESAIIHSNGDFNNPKIEYVVRFDKKSDSMIYAKEFYYDKVSKTRVGNAGKSSGEETFGIIKSIYGNGSINIARAEDFAGFQNGGKDGRGERKTRRQLAEEYTKRIFEDLRKQESDNSDVSFQYADGTQNGESAEYAAQTEKNAAQSRAAGRNTRSYEELLLQPEFAKMVSDYDSVFGKGAFMRDFRRIPQAEREYQAEKRREKKKQAVEEVRRKYTPKYPALKYVETVTDILDLLQKSDDAKDERYISRCEMYFLITAENPTPFLPTIHTLTNSQKSAILITAPISKRRGIKNMTAKECGELRRRLAPEKNCIERIYGCFVNNNKEIISDFEESAALLGQAEAEKYAALFKKILSGGCGRNLFDLAFTNEQVLSGEEHALLDALRKNPADGEARQKLYRKIVETYDAGDANYLILLAADTYDVPHRKKDALGNDGDSGTVFRYFLCAVCPVGDGKTGLGYDNGDGHFHSRSFPQLVGAPTLGFLYPAFDDRTANIYGALFYTKDTATVPEAFLNAVFHTPLPMPAEEQKENFRTVLAEALDEQCDYEIMQAIHEQITNRVEDYKQSKDSAPMEFTAADVGDILHDNGIDEEHIHTFREKCTETFGDNALLTPTNLINPKRFEIETPKVKISVDPESSYEIETRFIDGRKYILIPADGGVEVNGISIHIPREDTEKSEA